MTTTAPDLLAAWTAGWTDAVQQWADQSQSVWEQWGIAARPRQVDPRPDGHHHPGREHHHDDCECEADTCACCVPDADIVLRARVGERRVVPFVLHNRWRRDREVTVEVGPWHRCSGASLTITASVDDVSLTLGPCQDRVVRLLVAVTREDGTAGAAKSESGEGAVRLGDVEQCSSAYADVRFEGCARPQRVAVVVEPAHCDAADVDCDCGCC